MIMSSLIRDVAALVSMSLFLGSLGVLVMTL